MITLQDLTKEELIALVHHLNPFSKSIAPYVKEVRYQTVITQARQLSEESQTEMKAATGDSSFEGRKKFLEASDKFDRAMKLYDQADALLKEKSS